MTRIAALCVAGVFAGVMGTSANSADGVAREIHGSSDAFAVSGVALAWAVLRAPIEDDTAVVIRIDADRQTYTWIEVVGKDPFTQHEEALQRATAIGGPFDLKVPRAGFADHPRTEFRFWRDRPAPAFAPPALVIYYLGVPDTTPEVVRTADLDGSLSARIARAREESSRRAP